MSSLFVSMFEILSCQPPMSAPKSGSCTPSLTLTQSSMRKLGCACFICSSICSLEPRRESVQLTDPVAIIIKDDRVCAFLIVCPDLFRDACPERSRRDATFLVAAFHFQQDAASLAHPRDAKDRHRFGVLWFIRIVPCRGKWELRGVGEVHLDRGKFFALPIAIYEDFFKAFVAFRNFGTVL